MIRIRFNYFITTEILLNLASSDHLIPLLYIFSLFIRFGLVHRELLWENTAGNLVNSAVGNKYHLTLEEL